RVLFRSNLDLEALGFEIDVLDAVTTESGNPSDPGANSASIDVDVLNSLGINLPSIGLPLIGDGTNGGLIDLGDAAAAGLLNGYAASPESTESTAASGAVGADGAIDADAGSSTDLARVDLTGPLGQLGVDGLTAQIIDELSLELGAVASRAAANDGAIDREYLLAGAELNLSSPAVATVNDSVQAGVGDISDGVNALLGPERAVQGALDGVAIAPIQVGIDLPLLDTLLTVDLGSPELNASVDLSQVTEGLLDEPLVSDNGLVTIDLDSGIVNVDLAMLHQGDLNGLPANTELLSAQEIAQIVQTVNELLYEVLDLVTDAVTETLETTELTITLDPTLTA